VHTILFTGHRLDDEDRAVARFPREMEPAAHDAILQGVEAIVRDHGTAQGIAAGASGGDILFHEVCAELGIPSRVYLPLPVPAFVRVSVAPAGEAWVRRFEAVAARVPVIVESRIRRRHPPAEVSSWDISNLRLLAHATEDGSGHATVLALWNREPGDGRGGTGDLVAQAEARGIEVRILDTRTIFDM
jgi:hypothetical protein